MRPSGLDSCFFAVSLLRCQAAALQQQASAVLHVGFASAIASGVAYTANKSGFPGVEIVSNMENLTEVSPNLMANLIDKGLFLQSYHKNLNTVPMQHIVVRG